MLIFIQSQITHRKFYTKNNEMTFAEKWSVDFSAVVRNFQNASNLYGTDALIGIVFGRASEKRVTDVIFIESTNDDEQQKWKLKRIMSFFSPEVEALGLAILSTTPKDVSKTFIDEEKCSLKLAIEDFKNLTKGGKRLAAANPMVVEQTNLGYKDPEKLVQIRVKICTKMAVDLLTQCDEPKNLCALWPAVSENLNTSQANFIDIEAVLKCAKLGKRKPATVFLNSDNSKTDLLGDADLSSAEQVVNLSMELALNVNASLTNIGFQILWAQLLRRIIFQIQYVLGKEKVEQLTAHSFAPAGIFENIHIVVPVANSQVIEKYRLEAQKLLNLSNSIAYFYENQSILSVEERQTCLINPHEYIKYAPMSGGVCAVIRGSYAYHHYSQGDFEDSGWGCAYRSFQTIWSWLRHQNFTEKFIPTHREIQQCLVDIGDKKPNFVGSREWIGSLELSYCLETMLGISARILSTKSGADSLTEYARAIIFHFENYGAPIMIGGGQYAYTILGIDYDIRLGKCQFLVLDPHYKGTDDLTKVIQEQWCAWKPMSFWKKKCFYNLLLPITPSTNIKMNL